eukprot:10016734-Ditylum_brightwellii.AAC.1
MEDDLKYYSDEPIPNKDILPEKRSRKKNVSLIETIHEYDFDHRGTLENNRNWPLLPEEDQIPN